MAMPLIDQVGPGLQYVALDQIWANPLNPRQRFEPEALAELVDSVRALGILEPLVLTPAQDEAGGYLVVAGERRRQAAIEAGLTWVPAVIRDLDTKAQLEMMLAENIIRADLDPIEEARGLRRLLDECGLTQEELARRIGKSQPWISNRLRLLRLPEPVLAKVESGELSPGHAQVLLKYEQAPSILEAAAKQIVEKKIPVAEVEQKALGYLSGGKDYRVLGAHNQAFAARGCSKCESYREAGYQKICLSPECYDAKQSEGLAAKADKVKDQTGGLTIQGLERDNVPYLAAWGLRDIEAGCAGCDKLRRAYPRYGERLEVVCLDPECAERKLKAKKASELEAAQTRLRTELPPIKLVAGSVAAGLGVNSLILLLLDLLRLGDNRRYLGHPDVQWPNRAAFLHERFGVEWPGAGWDESLGQRPDQFRTFIAHLKTYSAEHLRSALVEWVLLSSIDKLGPALELVGLASPEPSEDDDFEDDYDEEAGEEL